MRPFACLTEEDPSATVYGRWKSRGLPRALGMSIISRFRSGGFTGVPVAAPFTVELSPVRLQLDVVVLTFIRHFEFQHAIAIREIFHCRSVFVGSQGG